MQPGDLVHVTGSSRDELNGKKGVVMRLQASASDSSVRYVVALRPPHKPMAFKADNLRRDTLWRVTVIVQCIAIIAMAGVALLEYTEVMRAAGGWEAMLLLGLLHHGRFCYHSGMLHPSLLGLKELGNISHGQTFLWTLGLLLAGVPSLGFIIVCVLHAFLDARLGPAYHIQMAVVITELFTFFEQIAHGVMGTQRVILALGTYRLLVGRYRDPDAHVVREFYGCIRHMLGRVFHHPAAPPAVGGMYDAVVDAFSRLAAR
eukprot:Sspe_Gene.26264::Locus_10804_Transcript_2_2_Confidence_0.750_Length_1074::g.26264::m.26264